MSKHVALLFTGTFLMLSACANPEAKYPTGYDRTETNQDIYAKRQSIMGDNGFCLGGSDERRHMGKDAPEVFGKAKISLTQAIKIAEGKTAGKAFAAQIDKKSNYPRYMIGILKNGRAVTVWVDGKTGFAGGSK